MEKLLNIFKSFILFVVYLLYAAIIMVILKKTGVKNEYIQSIILLLSSIIITIIYVLIYKNKIKKDLKDINQKDNDKMYLKDTFKYWIIGLLLMIIANSIIGIFITGISPNESANRELLSDLYIFAIPTMILFAPICEEIIFRLSIKDFISNKYLYVLTSGLLFGYAHIIGETGINLVYVIPYVILGLCFSMLYEKHKNIICPIIAHMIHNLVCIVLIVLL